LSKIFEFENALHQVAVKRELMYVNRDFSGIMSLRKKIAKLNCFLNEHNLTKSTKKIFNSTVMAN
jgi:hypothetical protein